MIQSELIKRAGLMPEVGTEKASKEELKALTNSLRDCYQNVNAILKGANGIFFGEIERLKTEKPTSLTQSVLLKGAENVLKDKPIADIVQQYLFLTEGVARIVERTAGHTFHTVFNPLSGTDISTAVSYLSGEASRNYLVTFDRRNIYASPLEKEKKGNC